VADKCLRDIERKTMPEAWIGCVIKTKQHEIEFDEELAESARTYVEYVWGLNADELWVEQKLSLAALDPPFDAGGTADAVAFLSGGAILEIVDFKNGRGVVEVAENKQLRSGALTVFLALDKARLRKVKKIKSTVVQPRATHKDGVVRSEIYDVGELVAWTSDLIEKMQLAAQAEREFKENDGNRVKFDEWAEKWLVAGGHCFFCPASGFCPENRRDALSGVPLDVKTWMEDPDAQEFPDLSNSIRIDDPKELGHVLDGLDKLERWIAAVRAWGHTCAENGRPPEGWMLADKIGNRAWLNNEDEHVKLLVAKGFTLGEIFQNKLRSPAQLEAVIGAKRKADLAPFYHKPVKGTNLVSRAKTTRSEAASLTERFMEKPE
jgi:hypothetical protein